MIFVFGHNLSRAHLFKQIVNIVSWVESIITSLLIIHHILQHYLLLQAVSSNNEVRVFFNDFD